LLKIIRTLNRSYRSNDHDICCGGWSEIGGGGGLLAVGGAINSFRWLALMTVVAAAAAAAAAHDIEVRDYSAIKTSVKTTTSFAHRSGRLSKNNKKKTSPPWIVLCGRCCIRSDFYARCTARASAPRTTKTVTVSMALVLWHCVSSMGRGVVVSVFDPN
jgi:hypothetical protein